MNRWLNELKSSHPVFFFLCGYWVRGWRWWQCVIRKRQTRRRWSQWASRFRSFINVCLERGREREIGWFFCVSFHRCTEVSVVFVNCKWAGGRSDEWLLWLLWSAERMNISMVKSSHTDLILFHPFIFYIAIFCLSWAGSQGAWSLFQALWTTLEGLLTFTGHSCTHSHIHLHRQFRGAN